MVVGGESMASVRALASTAFRGSVLVAHQGALQRPTIGISRA